MLQGEKAVGTVDIDDVDGLAYAGTVSGSWIGLHCSREVQESLDGRVQWDMPLESLDLLAEWLAQSLVLESCAHCICEVLRCRCWEY